MEEKFEKLIKGTNLDGKGGLEGQIQKIDEKFDKIDEKFDNGFSAINSRLDQMNTRIDSALSSWWVGIVLVAIAALIPTIITFSKSPSSTSSQPGIEKTEQKEAPPVSPSLKKQNPGTTPKPGQQTP